jgi:hypothetical protein
MSESSPVSLRTPVFEAALAQASDELDLQEYYRDCVRPLFTMPKTQWPRCCGRGCEPCAETLIAVATRVYELLAKDGYIIVSLN